MKKYSAGNNFLSAMFLLLITACWGNISQLYGQTGLNDQINLFEDNKFLDKRIGDQFDFSVHGQVVKAARFIPQHLLYGIEEWTAPSSKFSLDGIPFMSLPFNTNAVDFLPLDLYQISDIESIALPGISIGASSSTGMINLRRRPIGDSLNIGFRGYVGSVTGDPLIYTFTKPEYQEVNKNKIVPSGVLTISNRINKFSYRITSGYFGYYTAGFGNDDILRNINRMYLGKQNKQVLASIEASYNPDSYRKINLFSSFISYFGWDITPFITSFAHIESYLYTIRISAENIVNGVNLTVKKEEGMGEIDESILMPASKFSLSEISFYPSFSIINKSGKVFKLSADINYNSARDLSKGIANSTQKFFSSDLNKWTFGINAFSEYGFSKHVMAGINLRTEKNLKSNYNISAEAFSKILFEKHKLILKVSSAVKSPNLTELYGSFKNFGFLNTTTISDTFNIRGNPELQEERGNRISISHSFNNSPETFNIITEFFYHQIQKPIKLVNLRVVKTLNPGSVYRSAVYSNFADKESFGLNSKICYRPIEILDLSAAYCFTENSENRYTPRNKISFESKIKLSFNNILSVFVSYQSKTVWDDFIVKASDNFLYGADIYGVIPDFTTVDISYEQKIFNLLFIPHFDFRLMVKNIFNRPVKYLPEGNNIGRAVILTLSTEFL